MLTHPPAIVQVRFKEWVPREFFVDKIKRPPEGPAGADPAARGDDRGYRIERPTERESAVCFIRYDA